MDPKNFDIEAAQKSLETRREDLATSRPGRDLEDISASITRMAQKGHPVEPKPGAETKEAICLAHREALPCPVCAEHEADRLRQKEARNKALFAAVRIGRRYKNLTFDSYRPVCPEAATILGKCRRYAETFPDRLANGDSLLMLGNPGTGKNTLAACICKTITGQGYSALHTTYKRLTRAIKETYGRASDATEQSIISRFSEPDLLVIDEVSSDTHSEHNRGLLFEVVNDRYEDMKPTILISNLFFSDMRNFLGLRIADRFHEGASAALEFTWESYRRNPR